MMGSFLTRGLVMIFGYAYPAYECYKTVEKNKPEIEHLRFWCQYWILVAMLTVFERVGDTFVSWVPMYSEAKLAFFIYLWYPKTKGTTYVYDSFFRPYVAKHETEIDRNLLEIRTRAGDMAVLYWQKAASYGQTRVVEILHYVASQSSTRPRPVQQQQGEGARQPPPPSSRARQPATIAATQVQQPPPTRASSTGTADQQDLPSRTSSAGATATSQSQEESASETTPPPAAPAATKATSQTTQDKTEEMQIEVTTSSASANPTPEDTVMEETIRVTRGRLRKTRSSTNR
ncbi:hypothetical protein GIB67_003885 [Kingdonia uniflora]|uniref:HVA22-like protein n=1 Tax=Kingdonia uniflora TaxID=39325 RepID=A0A7J7LK41_9MAGN|nr:hypothetical protein GIB67_003885 [Kingdonia uniflora]